MWTAIKGIIESKKFVAGVLGTIAAGAGHFGFGVDVSTMLEILSPLMIAIGAQGWADSGKEAAKIVAAAADTSPKAS